MSGAGDKLGRALAVGAGVAVGLLFLAASVQKIWAGDFWGQLRTGQEILATLRLPTADDFSFTAAGREVREVRWLYCVIIALGWKVGAWALCWGQAGVLGAMWGVIVWRVRRVFVSPWAWLVLALGIVGGAGRWVLRPELATDLLIAVFLVMLEGARVRGRVGAAWWLVLAQVVWVNTHSVYVFGPVLAWMFAGSVLVEGLASRTGIGRVVRWEVEGKERGTWPRRFGAMALLAAAVTAACWVNPYFHRGATYAIEMWREAGGVVGDILSEMTSPLAIPISQWRWDMWCAAAVVVVMLGVAGLNWRGINPARLGVLVIALYLGATAQRNLPILVVMGVWATLVNLGELKAAGWDGVERRRWPRTEVGRSWLVQGRRVAMAGVAACAMGCAWYIASDRAWTDIGVGRETGVGVVEWDVPRGAAEFVVENGCLPQVYNHMREGHYLGWWTGGRIKVFVDGRTDVFGDEFLREYMSTGPSTWEAITRKWAINTAIVPVRGYEGLIAYLIKHSAWALVYLDHRNLVFVRDIPQHAALISVHRIDPAKSFLPRTGSGAEPVERVDAWKRLIGGSARPWYTFGMAQSFLAIGSRTNAERYLQGALTRFPDHPRAIAELAAIKRAAGEVEGERLLDRLGARSVWRAYSERTLARYLDEAGRREEATRAMERAFAAGESDVSSRVVLADWHFAGKNYKAAIPQYEAVIKGGSDTASEWKKLGYSKEQLGDVSGAARAYESSLARDAGQHEVWYLLGVARVRAKDVAGGREALERALTIKPDFGPARRALDGLGR